MTIQTLGRTRGTRFGGLADEVCMVEVCMAAEVCVVEEHRAVSVGRSLENLTLWVTSARMPSCTFF